MELALCSTYPFNLFFGDKELLAMQVGFNHAGPSFVVSLEATKFTSAKNWASYFLFLNQIYSLLWGYDIDLQNIINPKPLKLES